MAFQDLVLALGVGLTPFILMVFLSLRKPRARWEPQSREFVLRYGED